MFTVLYMDQCNEDMTCIATHILKSTYCLSYVDIRIIAGLEIPIYYQVTAVFA